MVEQYEFERTMALGERSMSYLKKYRTPAVPRHYELFYTYASGSNKELKEAVLATIDQQAGMTTAEAEKLYDAFLSPIRHCNQIGKVGESLIGEISEILGATASATNSTSAFGAALETVSDHLARVSNTGQLKTVLQTVVAVTRQMADNTHHLEDRLAGSKEQIEELQHHLEMVRAEAYTDPLTGIANRKRFDRTLKKAIQAAMEENMPLCLLMIDIDHFKKFNDSFGHQAGDSVLRLVARTMTANVKGRDLVARYGGEEFAVILPMTPLESAITVANQIREAVMANELVVKNTSKSLGRIHLSLGVASYLRGETIESLIQRSDTCLYSAKRQGRNRTVSERELDFENQAGNVSVA